VTQGSPPLTIDKTVISLTLNQNQGVLIFTDGTGYYTERGMSSGAVATDSYVLGTPDTVNLPNSVANPTAYYGSDAQPATAGTLDDEFNGAFNSGRWTFLSQGSTTTAANANSCVTLTNTTPGSPAANQFHGIYQTAPAAPWQVVVKANGFIPQANNNRSGIFVSDGTKITELCVYYNSGAAELLVQNLNNTTSFNGNVFNGYAVFPSPFYYYSIKNDGTNLNYYVSYDGINYWLVAQTALAGGFLTPTYVGVFMDNSYSATAGPPIVGTAQASFDFFRRTL